MTEVDELDINPFFKALQTNFLDIYDRAQAECNLICVPQSDSLQGAVITEKFVSTHILRPSPFFTGQYTTLRSENQVVLIADNDEYIYTEQGFPTRSKIKVISQELGYNKDYKPYKIVVVARPLDNNVLKFRGIENGTDQSAEIRPQYTFTGSKEFLYHYTDFEKPMRELETELRKFCSSYILLKDYLNDAAGRLQELILSTTDKCLKSTRDKKLKSAKHNLKDILSGAIEIYVIGSIKEKVYPVICEKCRPDDSVIRRKCLQLQGLSACDLNVPQHFCTPVPSAITELKKIDGLQTPVEKLYCLKATIDKITEEINSHIQKSRLCLDQTSDLPCLTSDDLIPILATVLVEASCPTIHSDFYFIENFSWLPTGKDNDTLSYCLVTFKAALHYLMSSDFDEIQISSSTPSSKPAVKPPTPSLLDPPKDPQKSPVPDRQKSNRSPKARFDQQMDAINKMLEESTEGLGTAGKKKPKPVTSIFGASTSHSPLPKVKIEPQDGKEEKDMGDFLASLQDNMFSFGKQT